MHEHNQASYPRPYIPAEQLNQLNDDGLLERSAPVLDSLARLLIREPGDQPVSVTVVPPNSSGSPSHRRTTVLVSQNPGVPAAVSIQLEIIIEYLSAARKLYLSERVDKRTIELTSPSEESPTDTPLQRELMELERALHRYCWAKEKRRLIKDGRHSLFKELVLNVYGVAADSLPELAEEVAEREALNALQNITLDEKELVGETACLIADLTSLLGGDPPPPPTSSDDPEGNKVVAPLLPVMHRLDTLASDPACRLSGRCATPTLQNSWLGSDVWRRPSGTPTRPRRRSRRSP
ncbi:hypothetical protein K466DRAFT_28044 [Polyporus arcularius HHB13444]|uniref:Uncharacterized protein n=1 Tax=Polyporus arcularius HHB13444 TaxID=1314778 RepID=A0A5C3PI25_9APHY|nr:hypothetical protein K466DRAFT_28044 [Polyporus arcularius HHB13444]